MPLPREINRMVGASVRTVNGGRDRYRARSTLAHVTHPVDELLQSRAEGRFSIEGYESGGTRSSFFFFQSVRPP